MLFTQFKLAFGDWKKDSDTEIGSGLYTVKMQEDSVTEHLNNFSPGDKRVKVGIAVIVGK